MHDSPIDRAATAIDSMAFFCAATAIDSVGDSGWIEIACGGSTQIAFAFS